MFAPLQDVPGLALHVSRIYRDARYAHGLPYKDSLWFSIRHDSGYWAQLPASILTFIRTATAMDLELYRRRRTQCSGFAKGWRPGRRNS